MKSAKTYRAWNCFENGGFYFQGLCTKQDFYSFWEALSRIETPIFAVFKLEKDLSKVNLN